MTIASALDKLNDKLAGSDQPAAQTIEGMILRIIDNIDQGGGGSIPVASADTLGGIKVGENLSITEGGVLSASGGGGGLVLHVDMQTMALDKTYAEIKASVESGCVPISLIGGAVGQVSEYGYDEAQQVYFVDIKSLEAGVDFKFTTETENGYPVYDDK